MMVAAIMVVKGAEMQALRLFEKEDVRLVDVPVPEINEDEVLIKIKVAAIDESDLYIYRNGRANIAEGNPVTLGREFSGTIERIGKNIDGFSEGMKVAVLPYIGCGVCDVCTSGRQDVCGKKLYFGMDMDGGLAEYIKIPREAVWAGNIIVIPEQISFLKAALSGRIAHIQNAIEKCQLSPAGNVLIIRAGWTGVLTAMLLRKTGADITVTDESNRLQDAKKILGLVSLIEYKHVDTIIQQREKYFDVVIETQANPQTRNLVLPLIGEHAMLLFLNEQQPYLHEEILDANFIYSRGLNVIGNNGYSSADFKNVMILCAKGMLPVDSMVTGEYRIEGSMEAFRMAEQGKDLKNVVVF
jgi:L-iditol 2-dehydrogenase